MSRKFGIIKWHCLKRVRIQNYSGPHFSAFVLNLEKYSVSLRIQSECEKIRTRIIPNIDTFCTVTMRYQNLVSLYFHHQWWKKAIINESKSIRLIFHDILFSSNLGQNILEFCIILEKISFTASKQVLHI